MMLPSERETECYILDLEQLKRKKENSQQIVLISLTS